jgi:hypothetical protein
METKNCQNCKKEFNIEPEDFLFYEKMKVPAPTFCADCSHQRRFAWRNTHSLYKRTCSATGKDVISIYSPDKKLNVVDQKYWWGDSWDPMEFGKKYDFSIPFFNQWAELRDTIPLQSLSNSKAVNSDYCNVAEESYDCYLISASWKCERTLYSDSISQVKDSSDLYVCHRTEFMYDSIYCLDCNKVLYSEKTIHSTDSYFLYDCKNCVNCFMCSNLRNKSYCIENVQYTKEEYTAKLKSIDLSKYSVVLELKKQYKEMKKSAIHRFATIINSHNVTGDNIEHGENSKYIFDASQGIKDSKHVFWAAINVNSVYNSGPGIGMGENVYELFDGGAGGGNIKFGNVVYYSTNVEYSFNCYNCVDCFGCYGLRNKKYCILNTQYEKEEYFSLVEKIKNHMNEMPYVDKGGCIYKYGEFFPIELSPFCYNETIAQSFFPMTKEEIEKRGYSYKPNEEKSYKPTMASGELLDSILECSNDITKEVIECEHSDKNFDRCSQAFRITKEEFIFYTRLGIPLPRMCYQCRNFERFKTRNPIKLWGRSCMCVEDNHGHEGSCQNQFETSYSPDRPETVYCDGCYQKEVL